MANSKLDWRIEQLDFQSHSLMQDMKKVRAEPERRPAQAQQELDSGVAEEADGFPSDHQDAEFPAERPADPGDLGLYLAVGIYRIRCRNRRPGNAEHGKELFETRGCLACHSIGEGSSDGWAEHLPPT